MTPPSQWTPLVVAALTLCGVVANMIVGWRINVKTQNLTLAKMRSDKSDRLRPQRLEAIWDMAELVHDMDLHFAIMRDRSTNDYDYDWDDVLARAVAFHPRVQKMSGRIKLLFQNELGEVFSRLEGQLSDVWFHYEYQPGIPPAVGAMAPEAEHQLWTEIMKLIGDVEQETIFLWVAMRKALAKIDSE